MKLVILVSLAKVAFASDASGLSEDICVYIDCHTKPLAKYEVKTRAADGVKAATFLSELLSAEPQSFVI